MTPELVFKSELYHLLLVGHHRFESIRPAELKVLLNRAAISFNNNIETQPAQAVLCLLKCQAFDWAGEVSASTLLTCFPRHLIIKNLAAR